MRDVSRLEFRVWPHDLDTSLHMNNGRYWTLMDLGRADLMIRSGLWKAVLKQRRLPVVSAAKIRFRRELRLFRPFSLKTRIVTWADTWVVIEHQVVSQGRDRREILNAVALVRAGLYDRRTRKFIAVDQMLNTIGSVSSPPQPTPEVAAFLAAEEAMKRSV